MHRSPEPRHGLSRAPGCAQRQCEMTILASTDHSLNSTYISHSDDVLSWAIGPTLVAYGFFSWATKRSIKPFPSKRTKGKRYPFAGSTQSVLLDIPHALYVSLRRSLRSHLSSTGCLRPIGWRPRFDCECLSWFRLLLPKAFERPHIKRKVWPT
ncbi:hypothetical protein BV25DRAFT_1829805 [Artomyces pyxidatus]|uniref:Uncharacterized protein n=1 Tax=Artomyces pyxidatus TaxID=48021 RepID=A0ACB8SQL9_9AGAM|nr:hypothetical protein BV25DRAFT_1829805 [Artomyces pyxidatus]